MKRLLLILAFCLMPLSVADACAAPLVTVQDMVQQVLETTASITVNAFQYTNQRKRDADEFMQRLEVAEDISDTDIQRVVTTFDKGVELAKFAKDYFAQAVKFAATATVEEGPVAVSLQLRAAAMFTDATVKLNRARAFFRKAEKAAAALLGVPVKNPC